MQMRAIEFLKQFPWTIGLQWVGTWGWTRLKNGNTVKVSLNSTSTSTDGRVYSGFTVEVDNPIHGVVTRETFRFQDFLEQAEGKCGRPSIIEMHNGEMEWQFGWVPISCHEMVNNIGMFILSFGM
jgi:hypothetical protein